MLIYAHTHTYRSIKEPQNVQLTIMNSRLWIRRPIMVSFVKQSLPSRVSAGLHLISAVLVWPLLWLPCYSLSLTGLFRRSCILSYPAMLLDYVGLRGPLFWRDINSKGLKTKSYCYIINLKVIENTSTPCSFVGVDRCFRDAYCLHRQGDDHPDDW
jgi:hypothetical protein